MDLLESGGGSMSFDTFHHHGESVGRLWSAWPTPLHVNRSFRACLFYPQKECWTDLDMESAHNHIAQHLALTVGVSVHELQAYLSTRDAKHRPLLEQGVQKREVKQLWLSLLNLGSVAGWKRQLREKYGCPDVRVPDDLNQHLSAFKREIKNLVTEVLKRPPWDRAYEAARTRGGRQKTPQAVLRSAWHSVLATRESTLMSELEELIHAHTPARVRMPSYDGLLLAHPAGAFRCADVQARWQQHCSAKYGYIFPIAVKDFTGFVPRWLQAILALEASQQQALPASSSSSGSKGLGGGAGGSPGIGSKIGGKIGDWASANAVDRRRFENWWRGPRSGRGPKKGERCLEACVARLAPPECEVENPCANCRSAYRVYRSR